MSWRAYKVGGCVRDHLLGQPVKDTDWVVVGATPVQMLNAGFQQVGAGFPVFLHPDTHEEYALARTAKADAACESCSTPEVTLEDDLGRRDLTINAMAEDENGCIVDPFNGRADLDKRILRHVSPAFGDDPLRVLRVARFAARYAGLGFSVAAETMTLMKAIAMSGQLDQLVAERVWQETLGALRTDHADRYIETLRACGALARVFPEIDRLFGIPQPRQYHPEIDTGMHTLMVMRQARLLSDDPLVVFAAMVHDLGKGITPRAEWPRHIGHEAAGVDLIKTLCRRIRTPGKYRELAVLVSRYHLHHHRVSELKPKTILKVLSALDAFRRPERFEQWLLACEADLRGRTGLENVTPSQPALWRKYFQAANRVSVAELGVDLSNTVLLAQTLRRQRIAAIASLCRT